MFLTIVFGEFTESAVKFTTITTTILLFGSISFWVLLRKGYQTLAAALTCLIENSIIASYSFSIPGEVVAGVIGNKKFAYDIWGDTVRIASRCESSAFQVGSIFQRLLMTG